MKITKRSGTVVLYDDEKVVRSILAANAGTAERLSKEGAQGVANAVFFRLTQRSQLLSTREVRDEVYALLCERGLTRTAENYRSFRKD